MQRILIFIIVLLLPVMRVVAAEPPVEEPDTLLHIGSVEVTSIKQGTTLRGKAIAATLIDALMAERNHISALKDASEVVPNFYIPDYGSRMTTSVYVRGLGARIDQPVVGMNIDNVPIMTKEGYDFEMVDIERIEILRGPQSTLYGRNTMGGVVNIYTLSENFAQPGDRCVGSLYPHRWPLRKSPYWQDVRYGAAGWWSF